MSPKSLYHRNRSSENTRSGLKVQTTAGHLNLNHGKLYYETAGEGEAVVLIHASFLDSRMFDAQWTTMAEQFCVIRYDMQESGRI